MKELTQLAKEISLLTLDISYRANTGHVGSCLSISDLLTVLYFAKINLSSRTVNSINRDRFILSKGHAAAALYAALYKKGIMSKKEIYSFGQDEGGLCEHPEIKDIGVEMTTGSLGHGLPFGIGIALGLKKKSIPAHVYVLISDGECGEGSIWEAAILAPRLGLDNLTVLFDYNKWQCFGKVDETTYLEPIVAKWRSFGWETVEIDGHDIGEIKNTLHKLPLKKGKSSMIIAHTISGRGISLIEDKLIGHYKVFREEEYQQARKELMEHQF